VNISRDRHLLIGIGAVVLGLIVSQVAPRAAVLGGQTSTFSAVACPADNAAGSSTALLTSPQLGARTVKAGNTKSTPAHVYKFSITNGVLFNGSPNSVLYSSRDSGSSLGMSVCSAGLTDQWFVGGSAGITSKGGIDLINSGLSESVVDLFAYTAKVALPVSTVTIKANSDKFVPLDALAPGSDQVVVHAITRSGQVSASLLDVRRKGLSSLGLDFVSPVSAPTTSLVIPALTNGSAASPMNETVRLLVPGGVDARIGATIYSRDGSFAPLGLDGLKVAHGVVVDYPLQNLVTSSPFALSITSDQPILASVLSAPAKSNADFAWSASAAPFSKIVANPGGLLPALAFLNLHTNVNVAISWRDVNGKSGSLTLSGSHYATWQPRAGLNRLSISTGQNDTYGGAIFAAGINSGFSYLPLWQGSALLTATVPHSDARVISRG
jgi:hypothetical protein